MAIDLPKGLGYAGTARTGAEHAAYLSMVGRGGAGYCGTIDAGRVSIVPSETRTVEIGPGPIYGNAILDEIPAGIRLSFPEEPAGSCYYLVARRAIWNTTDASRIDIVPGDDTRQIPTYLTDPGVEADTPLALVRITAGSPTPTEVVDLRLVAEEPGIYTIFDTMALALAMRPGVVCYHATTGITYRCVYQNGALAWLQSHTYGQIGYLPGYGAYGSPYPASATWRLDYDTGMVYLSGMVKRTGVQFSWSADASMDILNALPAIARPAGGAPGIQPISTQAGDRQAEFLVRNDGRPCIRFRTTGTTLITTSWWASLEGICYLGSAS